MARPAKWAGPGSREPNPVAVLAMRLRSLAYRSLSNAPPLSQRRMLLSYGPAVAGAALFSSSLHQNRRRAAVLQPAFVATHSSGQAGCHRPQTANKVQGALPQPKNSAKSKA